MSLPITIRKYVAADREQILDLFRLNTPAYFSPTEEKDLVYYLNNHIENYYVIESSAGILGGGGFNVTDDLKSVRISWDFFHPDYQGKGLGSQLIEYRIGKIKAYNTINTITVRTSQLAFRFYEKFGFKLKETIKDYWAEGFDLYNMEYQVERN